MKSDESGSHHLANLRERAEKKVKQKIGALQKLPVMDNDRLVHELQVHRIELEMQNEELRRAQLELEAARARYFNLFELAPIGYFTLDEKGLVIDVNLAGVALFGVQKRDLIGRAFSHYINRDSQDQYYLCHKKVGETGARQTCELKLRRKDGTEFHSQLISTTSASEQSDSSELRVAIIDISERKRAEEKVREYQAKLKEMAAKILSTQEQERWHIAAQFHDNISQKLVHTKLVLESSFNLVSDPNLLASLRRACTAMGEMIEDAETFTFELSDSILHELGFVAALDRYLAEEVRRKHGIACEFESHKPSDALPDGVKTCLFRITRELLTNVVKHAQARRVKVSVNGSSGRIRVSVRDDGVGFHVAEFDSTAAKTGKFGLFSIREQLDHLGGHLAIESESGRGTTATVVIPLAGKGTG